MTFDKFTAENRYFSLTRKLRQNSVFSPEIRVVTVKFSVIKIRDLSERIFGIIPWKKMVIFSLNTEIIL